MSNKYSPLGEKKCSMSFICSFGLYSRDKLHFNLVQDPAMAAWWLCGLELTTFHSVTENS